VSIVTFQQKDYIRQAVESATMQKTNFAYDVIVGDDASTDGTQDILRALRDEHPDKVKLLLPERNYGDYGLSNVLATIEAAQGEYIAFMDGDDYWTDPDKLQRQVDFMDAHPDCFVSAHRVQHLSHDGNKSLSISPGGGDGLWEVDVLFNVNFTPKSATMIRRSALAQVPDWYKTTKVASSAWLFNLLVAKGGKVGFLDGVMAVHRIHGASITAHFGAKRLLLDKLDALDTLASYYPDRSEALSRAKKRIRWKLRTLSWSPHLYGAVRRGYNFVSSRRR
jgi:glycosyltransferase involved in cell wall biosynthesis